MFEREFHLCGEQFFPRSRRRLCTILPLVVTDRMRPLDIRANGALTEPCLTISRHTALAIQSP